MRKIILILAVLMVTCPAWAAIDITCIPQPVEPNTATEPGSPVNIQAVEIRYSSDEANKPRAFAFNITVDNGATIVGVPPESVDPNFYVHPGSFGVDGEGNVTGSVVCDPMYPDTLPGGPEGITTEQASLYVGAPNAPGQTGSLLTVLVHSPSPNSDCNLMIAPNITRAGDNGVVMEDPDENVVVNYPSPCHLSAWCWCAGDISGPTGVKDGILSISDLSKMMIILRTKKPYMDNAPTYDGPAIDNLWIGGSYIGELACGDVSGPVGGNPDGILSISDLSKIMITLRTTEPYMSNAPTYEGPCLGMPAPEPPPE